MGVPGRTASSDLPCSALSILDVPEFRLCVWSHPGDTYIIRYHTSGPLPKHDPGGGGDGDDDVDSLGSGEYPLEETGKWPDCVGSLVAGSGAAVVKSLGKWSVDGDNILTLQQVLSEAAVRNFLAKLEAARKKSSDVPSLVAALLHAVE